MERILFIYTHPPNVYSHTVWRETTTMEPDPSPGTTTQAANHRGKIPVWRTVGRSWWVLLRNVVPFAALMAAVAFPVGYALRFVMKWLVDPVETTPTTIAVYYQLSETVLHSMSRIPLEAVIALVVLLDLTGRRPTLAESAASVARAIPAILHRPFYLLASRIFVLAFLRAVVNLPMRLPAIFVLTWEADSSERAFVLYGLSALNLLVNIAIDCRFLLFIPVVALERTSVSETLRRCWNLTSGHWPRLLGIMLLNGVPVAGLRWSLKGIAPHGAAWPLLVQTGIERVQAAVLVAVCYHRARIANGESTTEPSVVSATP